VDIYKELHRYKRLLIVIGVPWWLGGE